MKSIEIELELQATPEGSSFVAGTLKVGDDRFQNATTLYLATRNAEAIAELFAAHDLWIAKSKARPGQPPTPILNMRFRSP